MSAADERKEGQEAMKSSQEHSYMGFSGAAEIHPPFWTSKARHCQAGALEDATMEAGWRRLDGIAA